jgi:hypothetical protein
MVLKTLVIPAGHWFHDYQYIHYADGISCCVHKFALFSMTIATSNVQLEATKDQIANRSSCQISHKLKCPGCCAYCIFTV